MEPKNEGLDEDSPCRRGRLFGAILTFGGVVSLGFPRLDFCMDFQLFPFSEDIRLRWSPEISGTRLSENLVQSSWSNLLRWVKTALLGTVFCFFLFLWGCDVHRRKLLIQWTVRPSCWKQSYVFHRFLDWQHPPADLHSVADQGICCMMYEATAMYKQWFDPHSRVNLAPGASFCVVHSKGKALNTS